MRIAYKQKKHETFLRKQLLDDLHDELVQSIVEPLRVWTGAMLIKTCSQRFPGCNNACIGRKRAFVATQCMWRKKTMMKKSCRAPVTGNVALCCGPFAISRATKNPTGIDPALINK
jgi:hypothetical protein